MKFIFKTSSFFTKIIPPVIVLLLATGIFFTSCDMGKQDELKKALHPLTQHETDSLAKVVKDSILKVIKDSLKMAKLKSLAYFPLIKAGDGSGVLPVDGIDEFPDTTRQFNLAFDFSSAPDSSNKKVSNGFKEICRILNLHVASGIPLSHIHFVIITHGKALYSIFNNDAYMEKYKRKNPNDTTINTLMEDGGKFIACGQAMQFAGVKKSQFHVGVKVALTAKVALSNYIGQGYVPYDISDDE